MAKISKDELKKKVGELVTDNDIAIQLLEDIEDSMEVGEVNTEVIDKLQAKLDETSSKLIDLQEKYKERFLKGEEVEDNKEDIDKGLEEKEIIDVKVI